MHCPIVAVVVVVVVVVAVGSAGLIFLSFCIGVNHMPVLVPDVPDVVLGAAYPK